MQQPEADHTKSLNPFGTALRTQAHMRLILPTSLRLYQRSIRGVR